jgi:mannose-6-phosphate isomerase-like protein (cupin superfamily)
MPDYTIKRIDALDAIFGGSFRRARGELGVTSFGMQIMDLPPKLENYPEHDHAGGQEEVYLVLSGEADITVDGEELHLDPNSIIRVGPEVKRKITTGSEGARILALGGTPGEAFEPADFTEVGGPDPTAG